MLRRSSWATDQVNNYYYYYLWASVRVPFFGPQLTDSDMYDTAPISLQVQRTRAANHQYATRSNKSSLSSGAGPGPRGHS